MPELLEKRFARRMAPVAIAAGMATALVPPLTYRWVGAQELRAQAAVYANQLARTLRGLAEREPVLWHYNTAKVFQATSAFQRQGDIAAAAVLGPDGTVLYEASGLGRDSATAAPPLDGAPAGPVIGAPDRAADSAHAGPAAGAPVGAIDSPRGRPLALAQDGPQADAVIVARGRRAGSVRVTMNAAAYEQALMRITAVSVPAGVALALLVFLLPVRIVRCQARALSLALAELREAQAGLEGANHTLSARVQEATDTIRSLSVRVLDAQEHERSRIARDLHDTLGQALTALQVELELLRTLPARAPERLERAASSCSHVLEDLRRVVRDLRPLDLEHATATEALRSYVERFEVRTGVATSFRCKGDLSRCTDAVITSLLRTMQEALTNVARHARAHEAGVSVEVTDEALVLSISDDGVGFTPEEVARGSGLTGMRERCELLGGHCTVASTPREGTRVHAVLPLARGVSDG